MSNKKMSGLEALSISQELAFSPIAFQAARCMWKLGVLKSIEDGGLSGVTMTEISVRTDLSDYAVGVLLDIGLSLNIVIDSDGLIKLSKLGFFILNDEMTQVNMDFTHDVCYQPAFHLEESLKSGKPEGLKVFSDKATVYEALSTLPNSVQDSWFAFDHFYSQRSFPASLQHVFKDNPKHIIDVGGNTGKWALKCLEHCTDVHITIVDLPGQLAVAQKRIDEAGFLDRVAFHEADLLDSKSPLPVNADIVWMSQFLDCFSPLEIIDILTRVQGSVSATGKIFIMELFVDRQTYDAAKFSLDATSLYFTFLANGNSRMYRSEDFMQLVEKSGLKLDVATDNLGGWHTLLECIIPNPSSNEII
jgi:hypothetical protein